MSVCRKATKSNSAVAGLVSARCVISPDPEGKNKVALLSGSLKKAKFAGCIPGAPPLTSCRRTLSVQNLAPENDYISTKVLQTKHAAKARTSSPTARKPIDKFEFYRCDQCLIASKPIRVISNHHDVHMQLFSRYTKCTCNCKAHTSVAEAAATSTFLSVPSVFEAIATSLVLQDQAVEGALRDIIIPDRDATWP